MTPEALEPLFEKRMDGFSEVFHRISYDKIGTSTIQSRATAGVANATFIFVLPGSPGACRDAWDGILKAQLDYRHMPCNFVEIMPRLDEHLQARREGLKQLKRNSLPCGKTVWVKVCQASSGAESALPSASHRGRIRRRNPLSPFSVICTPTQSSRNAASRVTTRACCGPRNATIRSAKL